MRVSLSNDLTSNCLFAKYNWQYLAKTPKSTFTIARDCIIFCVTLFLRMFSKWNYTVKVFSFSLSFDFDWYFQGSGRACTIGFIILCDCYWMLFHKITDKIHVGLHGNLFVFPVSIFCGFLFHKCAGSHKIFFSSLTSEDDKKYLLRKIFIKSTY